MEYDNETYGERFAERYDQWHQDYDPAAITLLSTLAGLGEILELGIGTGRIALPLQQRGHRISGIDASPAMLAKLRAKPESETITLVHGNFANVDVEGRFSLIYVVFNTFYALRSQAEQLRCFQNVAQHLTPDGAFVLEGFVPNPTRLQAGQAVDVVALELDEVRLRVTRYDPTQQQLTSQRIVITEHGVRLYPNRIRYCWPSELDLMAHCAGLRLEHRWEDWQQRPFVATSPTHISVYRRDPTHEGSVRP